MFRQPVGPAGSGAPGPTGGVTLRIARLITTAILGASLGGASAGARCLSYEPAQVTLTGELTSRMVPGPPDYRSIARGDQPETVVILVLDAPVCVRGDPLSRVNSQGHAQVAEVQLVVDGSAWRVLRDKRVRVSGSLFARNSGHHRTPVVLTVRGLRAI